ncbi:MAG: hypothetical protein AMS24_00590 [Chlamydiae bacterium SM23_39]|nr:MAG: hypothetical protein AMS24_00590 [Chlamydiae bacterium SM23_39]
MFKFLRKNRKIILIITSAVIILSFSFFGTYNAILDSREKVKDEKVFEIKNKKIFRSDLNILSFLLDRENKILRENSTISKEFFQTRIVELLFEKNIDKLSLDFKKRLDRIKNFDLYVYPYNPNISLENILKNKNPKILRLLNEIKKIEKIDLNTFKKFSELYIEIDKVSKIDIQNKLLLQQKNSPYLPLDRSLFDVNFNIFPFSNISEWLGESFLDIIFKFIFEVADFFEDGKKEIKKKEVEVELLKFYPESNRRLVNIWKKVLLFKKYMQQEEKNLFLDNLCLKKISSYADKKAKLKIFKLPKYLIFKEFKDFLKLLLYLEITSDEEKSSFSTKYKRVEEIEKKYPSLIENHFIVEIKKTDMDEAGTKISEKKLWQWQVDEKNYKKLKDRFYILNSFEDDTEDKRFNAFENISANRRKEIDEYSRKEMVKENKDIIKNILSEKEKEKKDLYIRGVDSFPVLEGVSNKNLIKLLEKKSKNLFFCSDNEELYYQINCLSKKEKSIISFKKGMEDKTLENILNNILYSFYKDLKKDNFDITKLSLKKSFNEIISFLKYDSEKFEEVEDKVGIIYFSDVLGRIDERMPDFFKKNDLNKKEKYFIFSFLYLYMDKIKNGLINKIIEEKELMDDKNQWKLEIFDKEISRVSKSKDTFESYIYRAFNDLIFEKKLKEDSYSMVNLEKDLFADEVFFFKFLKRKKPGKIPFERFNEIKEVILNEAKYKLAEEILKKNL